MGIGPRRRRNRTGVVAREITGMVGTIPVGTRIVVTFINEENGTCTVERPDGSCCTVGIPVGFIQFDTYVSMLEEETYAHDHNPACRKAHLVRLVGHGQGMIDHGLDSRTKDIIGAGDTFEEAAEDAWRKKYGDIPA